jgi:membrane protease YdiL (CAAX protease family)
MELYPVSPKKKAAIITGTIVVTLSLFLLRFFIPADYSFAKKQFVFELILWGIVAFIFLFALLVERTPVLMPEERYSTEFYLGWILKLFFLSFGVNFLVAIVGGILHMPYNNEKAQRIMEMLNNNTPLLLFTALTAGVTEELTCRGYILTRLQLLLKNNNLAIGISSALFCTLHFGYHSYQQIIFTFIFGCIFAVHYQRYRSMAVLILAHIFLDLAIFLWYGVK